MPHLDDLQKLLYAMAHATEVADAAGFIQRCDAIDLLELHLAEFSNANPRTRLSAPPRCTTRQLPCAITYNK